MSYWEAAIWGLAGGMSFEGLELYARIRRVPGWTWRKPIPQGLVAYCLSVMIRAGFSIGVAVAGDASGEVVGGLAMFALGVAAPLVIEKLARGIPISIGSATVLDELLEHDKPDEQSQYEVGGANDPR